MTPGRRDKLILGCILALATALRFVNLAGRGEWDDDQGTQLLDVLMWVRHGQVPLLGPVSSVGTAHHGVAFYVLLAPGAVLTDNDPVAALTVLALLGVVGVAATWWLARTVGGVVAGHIAGLLAAVSPSAIQASTFVWNSNIVGPGAAVAAAAAWHAWRTRRPSWWMLSAVGAVVMLNGHLLAVIVALPIMGLLIADVRRRSAAERRRMAAPALAAMAIVFAAFIPLLIHESRHDFAETRAIANFILGNGPTMAMAPPAGLPIVVLAVIAWRVLVWPVSGLVTSAPLVGIPAAAVTLGALLISATGPPGITRQFGRWAVATVLWSVLALTLMSPSLGVIVAGLPNDQYHAWLDPILFAAIGVAGARLASGASTAQRVGVLATIAACVGLSLMSMPPLESPDGGWRKASATAERIHALAGNRTVAVTGVVKPGAAIGFPLRRQNVALTSPRAAAFLVVVCDRLFEPAIGLPCGGKAEEATAAGLGFPTSRLMEQLSDGPRRVVSIFAR